MSFSDINKYKIRTVLPALVEELPARDCLAEELPERRPRFVSLRAAARLVLLISAAKPAKPFFDEEPDIDVLATLANAACLTRAGELTRRFLVG